MSDKRQAKGDMTLPGDARDWIDGLREFVQAARSEQPAPTRDELSELEDEQRRVSGGGLMQFLNFVQTEPAFELFPVLESQSIADRAFVFAADEAGFVAAGDIIDADSERAIVVTKEEWREWLDDPETDADREFEYHYEYWSVWHRDFRANWDIPDDDPRDFWIHEEGFALADRAGRGSRHLWAWDGEELELVEQSIDEWTSSPD